MSSPNRANPEASAMLSRILAVAGITSSPNPKVSAILIRISAVAQAFEKNEPGARESLIDLSQALLAALELPSEAIQRMGWAEPARAAHCRIAVELKLFEHLNESGENGMSASALAEKTGAEDSLVARIVKHLAAIHVVGEKAAGVYVATPCSNAFIESVYRDGIIYTYDVLGPSFYALPEYLKRTHYRNPTELANSPFQHAHQTQLPFSPWLEQNPPYFSIFNSYMSAYRAGKPTWCDPGFYPISERLVEGFDVSMSDVLLVDVGGGLGRDLQELREKHPLVPGKLILQDRPEVISTIPADSKIIFQSMSHDFFTPQPVKHARAYYLHSVLHNRGNDDCVRILNNLKPALKSGYSKILLNEIVVLESHASLSATSMDQLALVLGTMHERTELQWRDLLQRAGLRVVSLWTYPGVAEGLIEAELA